MTNHVKVLGVVVAVVATFAVPLNAYQYSGGVRVQDSLLVRAIKTGVERKVDMPTVQAAIVGLMDGSVRLPKRDFYIQRGERRLPAAQLLWNGYMRTVEDHDVAKGANDAFRKLTMLLLEQGLNASFIFDGGHFSQSGNLAGTPLGYLTREMWDPEFIDAYLDAGHQVGGTIVHVPPRQLWATDPIFGVSYIHFVANSGLEIKAIREFYRLSSCYSRARTRLGGGSDEEFNECLKKTGLRRMANYSPTAESMLERLRSGAELEGRNMSIQWAGAIDYELHMYVLDKMFALNPDFEWMELIANIPPEKEPVGEVPRSNPIVLATVLGKTGVIDSVVRAVKNIPDVGRKNFAREMLALALVAKSGYQGRSALHIGAMRKGKRSKLWASLLAAERLASGHLDRLGIIRDDFGKTPNDYDGTSSTVTRYSVTHVDDGDHTLHTDAAQGVSVDFDGGASVVSNFENNGGWGGTVSEPPLVDDCDLPVYHGMPSREQLTTIIERNQPSIFRGAVTKWKFRDVWQKHKFVSKFANTSMQASEIPYVQGFDDGATLKNMQMADFLSTWDTDANESPESGAPMYLFGSDYTDSNPALRDDIKEFFDLLVDKTDANAPVLRELSPQFFLGPTASGAPMHWHNTALNALAFGEKQWFLLPPNSTYYSVLPSSVFAVDEVPSLRSQGQPVMTCTQRAGDLIFVGESYGHATLNTAPSIGFALEFCIADLDISVNVPPFAAGVMNTKKTINNPQQHQPSKTNQRSVGGSRVRTSTHHQPYAVAAKGTWAER